MMTGLQGREVLQSSSGWLPIDSTVYPGLVVMSIGFLLTNPKEAVRAAFADHRFHFTELPLSCILGHVARAQEKFHD
jgi:hypothetical protein